MYRYPFCCRSVNPFLSKALVFAASSHYIVSSGQQED